MSQLSHVSHLWYLCKVTPKPLLPFGIFDAYFEFLDVTPYYVKVSHYFNAKTLYLAAYLPMFDTLWYVWHLIFIFEYFIFLARVGGVFGANINTLVWEKK